MRKFIFLFIFILILIPIILFIYTNKSVIKNSDKNKNPVSASTQKVGFLASEKITFPSDLSFSKAMNARDDIGKVSLYYDYNPISLDGTEWVATKEINSESDYQNVVKNFQDYYHSKIFANGWTNEQVVNGKSLQPLAADSELGGVLGYLKYSNGSVQVILFYNQRDSSTYPANVQLRLFLSNVYKLEDIIK